MELVLVVADLLGPGAADTAPGRAPSLARLLACAGAPARGGDDVAGALAARYGVVRQDDWPLAPILLATLGVDPGDAWWIAADLVTLVAGRDDVGLGGAVADLDRREADAIVAALNAHFAQDGVAFVAPRPDALFARAASPQRLVTHPPAAAAQRPLHALLPSGADAPTWLRWQSEIQMLLHAHPLNAARERQGRASANSVWFHGGGTLPPRPAPPPRIRTFATDAAAVALAAFVGAPAGALPAGLDDALADAADAATIVAMVPPETDLDRLETAWADPAWRALLAGRLAAVAIVADDGGAAVTWSTRRPRFLDRLRGRMRRPDLAALVAEGRRA